MSDYRALLRSVLETTIDVIAFKDREGRYLAASRSLWQQSYGLRSARELIGRTEADFWPPERAARLIEEDIHVATSGEVIGPVEEAFEIHGQTVWASWTKSPIYDKHGELVGSCMLAHDITADKLSELALRDQAVQLSVVLETQRQLAEISDPAEAQELIAARALDLTGGDSAGVLTLEGERLRFGPGCGKHWAPGSTIPLQGTLAGAALVGGESQVVSNAAELEGFEETLAHGLRSGVSVPLKHGGRWSGVLQAVSEEPHVFGEEERNALELLAVILSEFLSRTAEAVALARFAAVYGHAPIGIGTLDLDGRITRANDRLGRATNRSGEDLLGMRLIECVHAEDRPSAAANFERLLHGECDSYHEQLRVLSPTGELLWVQSAVSLVRDAAGRPAFAVAMVKDITQQKRAEEELRRQEAEARIHQKLEAVGQLAAGIAHEMNTPMQFVGDSVHFLEGAVRDTLELVSVYRDALAAVEPELRERIAEAEDAADIAYVQERVPVVFERVYAGVERVSSLVRAMKSFAHTSQTEESPADLNEAIQTTLTVARNEYKYVADIELELGALPPVLCNVSDLNQVFLNVIVNAAQAIEDAGRGTEQRGTIRIRTSCDGEQVMLMFSDDGCGIPEEVLERIFDPFFTTKEVGRGSGQGLALVHNIIERHGGSISCSSEVGTGTTFVVHLPIRRSDAGDGAAVVRRAA